MFYIYISHWPYECFCRQGYRIQIPFNSKNSSNHVNLGREKLSWSRSNKKHAFYHPTIYWIWNSGNPHWISLLLTWQRGTLITARRLIQLIVGNVHCIFVSLFFGWSLLIWLCFKQLCISVVNLHQFQNRNSFKIDCPYFWLKILFLLLKLSILEIIWIK